MMIGSLFGILVAFLILYYPLNIKAYELLTAICFTISILFLFIHHLAFILGLKPLQKASQSTSPYLLNLFKKDSKFHLISYSLFVFLLYTFWISIYLPTFNDLNKNISIAIWFVLVGTSFDCLKFSLKRILNYLNPFSALDLLKFEGIKNIQTNREIDLCDSFDALAEAEVKAIQNSNPFLAIYGLNNTQRICSTFLESSRNIGHQNHDSQIQSLGIEDQISFVLSHLFQRMDFVFQEALKYKLKMTLNSLITNMGKIIISSAKCDLALTPHPILQLGKFAEKSLENNFSDVAILASCTLLEVAKAIINEIDCTYLEIQETFLCIISQLEIIAKMLFKQDKNSKIAILLSPFLDLKKLFNTEKNAVHQDTQALLKDLDRITAEFQMLETVMRTIPATNPINPV